jgi:hypothetical protein
MRDDWFFLEKKQIGGDAFTAGLRAYCFNENTKAPRKAPC